MLRAEYRQVGLGSVDPNLNDSDWNFSRLGFRGIKVAGSYGFYPWPDPNNLRLQTPFNGKTRQDWTTGDMIFNRKQLVTFCASILTIKPDDILFTGTPQGVVFGEKKPAFLRRWVQPGDQVVSSIEGLGALRVQFT